MVRLRSNIGGGANSRRSNYEVANSDVNNLSLFRRETMPLNAAAMAENPHYESQTQSAQVGAPVSISRAADPEEVKISNPIPPPNVLPPEYQVIASSCLQTIKDLGEGAFGRVHLAEYCNPLNFSSSSSSSEKLLVAVSRVDMRSKIETIY